MEPFLQTGVYESSMPFFVSRRTRERDCSTSSHLDIVHHAATPLEEMAPKARYKLHRICFAVSLRKNGARLVHAGKLVKVLAINEGRTQSQFLPGCGFELKLPDPKCVARQIDCRPLGKAAPDLQGTDALLQCPNRLR